MIKDNKNGPISLSWSWNFKEFEFVLMGFNKNPKKNELKIIQEYLNYDINMTLYLYRVSSSRTKNYNIYGNYNE